MKLYFSKTTRGFYNSDLHGDNIPADSVEISKQQYEALMEAQSQGKWIVGREDGTPEAKERPAPSLTQQKASVEAQLRQKALEELIEERVVSDVQELGKINSPQALEAFKSAKGLN